MNSPDDVKAQAQQRFGAFAHEYVTSTVHAQGEDLDRLAALAAPQPGWLALDVATGGGYTALRLAPQVARVVACDLTPAMLAAARAFTTGQGARNLVFTAGDAEHLPFRDGVFDLVTCRIAPHHFPDCFRFVQECARTLKPGGRLAVQDQLLPDEPRAARYIDSFERLRDPSHHRAFDEHEWRGMFLDAGLQVAAVERCARPANLLSWARVQNCSPAVVARLQVMLAQAPAAVRDWMHPRCAGTPDAAFDHIHILILGIKP